MLNMTNATGGPREFQSVVTGLWDSWADNAWCHDQASGIFFDPEKMHVLDHNGPALVSAGSAEHC